MFYLTITFFSFTTTLKIQSTIFFIHSEKTSFILVYEVKEPYTFFELWEL